MMWFAETQGPMGFPEAFSGDRPFLSGIYIVTTSLLGSSPIQWQVLGLFSRWLLGMTLWWFIRELWPERPSIAIWVGLLSVVFPGFKQQPISVVYGNGLFPLISYFASYALMLTAMRKDDNKNRIVLYISSVITYALCLFSTEYYIGLDVIRGVIIWLRLKGNTDKIRRKMLNLFFYWIPFLIPLGLFLFWRVFIFKFPTYQPVLIDSLASSEETPGLSFIYRLIRDPYLAGWQAWAAVFKFPRLSDFHLTAKMITWAVIAGSSLFAVFSLQKLNKGNDFSDKQQKTWYTEVFLISFAALFFAGWPFWITGLPIEIEYPYDRFLLAFLLGSCLFIVGLLDWLVRKKFQKTIILALIIGMSIGSNFENANSYRREWLTHNQFFQQLLWRAPEINSGTMLLTYDLPFSYYSDNSLTAPLNLIYSPENKSLKLDYFLGLAPVRVGRSIPELKKGMSIEQNFRNAKFSGTTDNMLIFFYSPPGCLRILDPTRDINLPVLPADYKQAIHLSNLSQISSKSNITHLLPANIFGEVQGDSWCYYYENAELERQKAEWDSVVEWIEIALERGFSPAEPSEQLIYVEALYHINHIEKAIDLTTDLYFNHAELTISICDLIKIVADAKPDMITDIRFQDMLDIINCPIE